MKVLIAEDDPGTQYYLRSVLSRWGYKPVVCGDGQAAWAALEGPQSPRLVLLDWMMPGLDGLDVCRRLRQDASGDGVYIILITSRDSKQDLLEGLTAGADDYLVKPFDAKELRARLRIGERVVQRLERLEERERTLQDFIDNAVELIQLVDADGHFIYVNQAWRECLDYSDAEVAQLKIWDIVHPDSQDYCQALFGRILQGEEVGLIETKFIT